MKAMKTTKLAAFLLVLAMAFLAPGCSSPTLAGKGEQVADYRWACPIRDLYWGIGQEEALRKMGLSETEYTVLEPQGEEVEKGIVYLELKSPIAMFGAVPEYTRLVFYEDFGLTDIILLYRREQTQQVAQRAQQFLGKPQHRPTDYRKKGKKGALSDFPLGWHPGAGTGKTLAGKALLAIPGSRPGPPQG